jgi:RNase P subunit RPR2
LPGRKWELKTPALESSRTTLTNPAWEELDCSRCHETIAKEWASTRHAQAWNEEVYQEELATIKRQSKCTSCHAPQPLLVNGIEERVTVRDNDRHLGIDCRSCHLGADGSIHGPWGAPTEAHKSTKSKLFDATGSNELCLSCHSRSVGPVIGIGRDFDDAELSDRGFSCVGCHMAPVERPIANQDGLEARLGRSHLLQTPRDPAFLRQAFAIEVERIEGGARLEISNRAGHRVPGLNDRFLIFELDLQDASGASIARDEVEISRSEPLGVAESIVVDLAGVGAASLLIRGVHEAESITEDVVFLEQRFPLGD